MYLLSSFKKQTDCLTAAPVTTLQYMMDHLLIHNIWAKCATPL